MTSSTQRFGAPGRFLLAGAMNAAATFALYLTLLRVVDYRVAYTAAFVFGIGLAYVLNRSFVFRTGGGIGAMVLLPFVYLIQYGVSVVIVTLWVEALRWPAAFAPLAAIVVTIPLTYVLSRWVFIRRREPRVRSADGRR
jgi:putative flippase GtrA